MGHSLGTGVAPLFPGLSAEAGIYSYDVRSGITRGCGHLAEYFGIPKDQCEQGVQLAMFLDAIHPDDRSRVVAAVDRTVRDGGLFVERYRTHAANGDEFRVRATGYCFRDERNRPASFVGAVEPEGLGIATNVDRTIEYALAAYRLAGCSRRPMAQYLIALALEDMGFVLPAPSGDH